MRLNYKLMIMSGLIGVPLILASVYFIILTQREMELKIRNGHADLAVHLAETSDSFFNDFERFITTFLYNYDTLSRSLIDDDKPKLAERNQDRAEALLAPMFRQFEHFRTIMVMNRKGRVVALITSGGDTSPTHVKKLAALIPARSVITDKQPFTSEVYKDDTGKSLLRVSAYPFHKKDWLLAVEMDMAPLQKNFTSRSAHIGGKGFAFLLDSKGRLVAHPDMRRALAREDLSDIPEIKKHLKARAGGVAEFKDKSGEAMLGAFNPVSNGWLVVVQEPRSDAYYTIEKMKNLAVVFALLSAFFAVSAGLYVVRSLIKPMNNLILGTKKIGGGDLTYRADDSTNDEMGQIARAFNEMGGAIADREKAIQSINDGSRELTTIVYRDDLAFTAIRIYADIVPTDFATVLFGNPKTGERTIYLHEKGSDVTIGDMPEELLALCRKAAGERATQSPDIVPGAPLQPVAAIPILFKETKDDGTESVEIKGAVALAGRDGSRAFSRTELDLFEIVASSVAVSLRNIELLEETVEKTRMQQELQTAELLQKTLFPKSTPDVPGLDLSGYIESASETGGDWYGFVHEPQNNRIAILIADVTGHGVPAALVTATTNSFFRTLEIFRSYAHQALDRASAASYVSGFDPLSPDFMLRCLNEIIIKTTEGRLVMTLFACVYYYDERRLVFANAGHNMPMVYRPEGFPSKKKKGEPKHTSYLLARGLRLGDEENANFKEQEIQIQEDDVLLWYTDGIIECENPAGEEYGEARLKKLLESMAGRDADDICDTIYGDAQKFYAGTPHKDDITLIVGRAVPVKQEIQAEETDIPELLSGVRDRLDIRKALIVNSDARFVKQLSWFLTGHGAEVRQFKDSTAALASGFESPFDLCVAPIGKIPDDLVIIKQLKDLNQQTGFLFTTEAGFDSVIPLLLELGLPLQLVDPSSPSFLTTAQIAAARLFSGPFWGVGRHLTGGTQIHTLRMRDTATRMRDAAPLFDFAARIGMQEHTINVVSMVADELLMNAMYDAPRDRNGNCKYASLSRTNPVKLSELEAPVLEYGSDGTYLGVGITDPFGALTRQIVLGYFEKCLFNRDNPCDDKPGGAGLGLYEIYRNVDHLIFNVDPGRRTEVICLFRLKLTLKYQERRIESLGFFERSM